MRQGDGNADRFERSRNQLLMRRVREREEQADGCRFHWRLVVGDPLQCPGERGFVERCDDFTGRAHSLERAQSQLTRHERRGSRHHQVVEIRTSLPADLDNVLEAFSSYEGSARALAFQKRVGGDRSTVDDLERQRFGVREYACDARQYRFCGVVWSRRRFEAEEAGAARGDEIGERAAGINSNPDGFRGFLRGLIHYRC